MSTTDSTHPTNLNPSFEDADSRTDTQIFGRIANNLIDERLFIPIDEDKKYSTEPGWNERENFVSSRQGKTHINEGGNIGVILGNWIEGTTYVLFDIEKDGILPDDVKSVIDPHTVVSFRTPHGGHNRLVRIENQDAYDLLNRFQTTLTDLSEGDSDDLELITNGASPIPPSEVAHGQCSGAKPCGGFGSDRYTTISINPSPEPLGIHAVERLGDLLELEPDTDPDYDSKDIGEVPSPNPTFNIKKEFDRNVPHVEHSFNDRLEYMKFGDWKAQEHLLDLWNGNFDDISGSNKQGKGECRLANHIGFFFGRNERMVRLLMSQVPFESHYQKYPSHRKFLLKKATNVDWIYCDEVHLGTKLVIADAIRIEESISKTELQEKANVSERHIQRIVPILEKENVITTDTNNRELTIKNTGITQGYIGRLDNIANEKDDFDEEKDTSTNVTTVEI